MSKSRVTLCSHCRSRLLSRKEVQTHSGAAAARRTVEPATIQKLLSGITDLRDRALFSLLVATGLRAGEIQQLDKTSIQVEQYRDACGNIRSMGVGKLSATKNLRPRRFFLDEVTLVVLQEYLESRKDSDDALFIWKGNRRMDGMAIRTRLSHWSEQLGLPHIAVHQFRKSLASALAQTAANPAIVGELMGSAVRGSVVRIAPIDAQALAIAYLTGIKLLRQS
jgi:site-specific recombinase XerC